MFCTGDGKGDAFHPHQKIEEFLKMPSNSASYRRGIHIQATPDQALERGLLKAINQKSI